MFSHVIRERGLRGQLGFWKLENFLETLILPLKGSHLNIRHSLLHSLIKWFYPLLSYVQIRVSVILSLGYRFSLAGPRSLGVALEVGHLVFLYPAMIPLPVVGGLCLGFFLPSVWRTWTNLPGLQYRFVVGWLVWAQSTPELGRSFPSWFLWCILHPPPVWFSFVEIWPRVWVSPPFVLVIDFWFGVSSFAKWAVGSTCPLPGVSLSIGLENLVGSLIVDWAFANLYSITECTQLGSCWTKWPLGLYWFRYIGSTSGSDA